MAQKKLLTNGNVFKRTDKRWGGVVWYSDEQGGRRRKSFSITTKQEVNRKITDYIAAFNESKIASQEPKKRLRNSIQGWLVLFKFPSVERITYDHCECTARNQIYPMLGDKTVGDITAADIKALLNHFMNTGVIKRVDEYERKLIFTDKTVIPIDGIYGIDGEIFNGLY